jgi:hypothetical protein
MGLTARICGTVLGSVFATIGLGAYPHFYYLRPDSIALPTIDLQCIFMMLSLCDDT